MRAQIKSDESTGPKAVEKEQARQLANLMGEAASASSHERHRTGRGEDHDADRSGSNPLGSRKGSENDNAQRVWELCSTFLNESLGYRFVV